MAEKMTSREDAAVLKVGIDAAVDTLEREGFGRGEIGAAMAGRRMEEVASYIKS